MTDALLDTIEAALKAATPGPWIRGKNTSVLVGDGGGIPQTEANAELIAHAPGWLTFLCGEVRRLQGERDKEMQAAKMLCDIYFNIAESVLGADEVRKRRDEAVSRTVTDLRFARLGAGSPASPEST